MITEFPSGSAMTQEESLKYAASQIHQNIPVGSGYVSAEEPDFRHQQPMNFAVQPNSRFLGRMTQMLSKAEDRERQFGHRARNLRTLLALLDKNPELLQVLELLEEIQVPI